MANGEKMVDLKTQEIVFLGNMFVHDAVMTQYAEVVSSNGLISTEPAKSIWEKMLKHYKKYGCLPSDDLFPNIFTEKELENLSLGIAIAGSEVEHAQFVLDCFADTAKVILFKQSMARLEKLFDDGKADLVHADEAIATLTNSLLALDRSMPGKDNNLVTVRNDWQDNKLAMQAEPTPIPIPGLEFVRGTPPGSVNVIVGGYGSGKSSSLCTMAAELVKTQNVLYVTLEMPAEVISFKIMACQTKGKIPAQLVFMSPKAFTDNEVKQIMKEGERVASPYNVYLLDLPAGSATADQLALYLSNLKSRAGITIGTVIVDYAALMKTNSGAGREDIGWGYTGVILKELSALAKGLGITVWVAAQAGGEMAHTVTSGDLSPFRPLRGGALYGSKEVLQDASYVLGLSLLRSKTHPSLAAGVLSTIKNRYGSEFHDYLCTMNYATSTLHSDGIIPDTPDGDIISLVNTHLQEFENADQVKSILTSKGLAKDISEYYFKGWNVHASSVLGASKQQTPKGARPEVIPTQRDSREGSY